MRKILILLILCLMGTSEIISQNVTDHNKRKREIEEEIAYLDKQLAQTKNKQKASLKDLEFIKRKINNRKKLLTELENEIKQLDSLAEEKEQQVNKLQSDYESLKKGYSRLVYVTYKNRDRGMWLMYILSSDNIAQGYRRWVYFRDFASSMRSKASEIRVTGMKVENEKKALDQMKKESISAKDKKQKEFLKLQKDEKGAKNMLGQLSKKESEVRSQLAEKKRERERLNREIERILASAVKEKSSSTYKENPADKILSDKFENNRGRLPWPVKKGTVTDSFGQHYHPVFKNIKLPFNNGITIETEQNANALCVFDGVVKQILVMPGYNQCVLVQHGSYYTFYCKLDKVYVKSGEKVSTGQAIGSLSIVDGVSTIHFQLWNGTVKQNPESWLAR